MSLMLLILFNFILLNVILLTIILLYVILPSVILLFDISAEWNSNECRGTTNAAL